MRRTTTGHRTMDADAIILDPVFSAPRVVIPRIVLTAPSE